MPMDSISNLRVEDIMARKFPVSWHLESIALELPFDAYLYIFPTNTENQSRPVRTKILVIRQIGHCTLSSLSDWLNFRVVNDVIEVVLSKRLI